MGIKTGIKDALEKKKQELRQKRLGKVMDRVSQEQAKKEKEFQTIATNLDTNIQYLKTRENEMSNKLQELEKRIRRLEGKNV